ncbi:MAG: hypothetical protein AAF891_01910 [Pseudomonadota bacterium]
MFREWGFLISEMIVLIVLAALLGLFVGWLIWGRRGAAREEAEEVTRLERALSECRAEQARKDARIAELMAAAENTPVAEDAPAAEVDYDGDGVLEGPDEGVRPEGLSAAREGQPDDLKQIKGIGPKLEQLCNALGFFHFDQIAGWTPDEVAWVDANLEGFKGRVSRDDWIAQARTLAAGGQTEFSRRVEDGDVY